jgi:hypothetical protein
VIDQLPEWHGVENAALAMRPAALALRAPLRAWALAARRPQV